MVRAVLLALGMLGVASGAGAQDAPLRSDQRLFGAADGDRALIQACMQDGAPSCETVVQDACSSQAAASGDDLTGVFARACDERAIEAWEAEMNASLAALRGRLSGREREDLDRSQRAWRDSVLADVQMAVDSFQGGTGAGLAADQVQARATARRALFLAEMNESFE